MSTIDLGIGLVEIALHGVSREIAETALSGLEGELARRIDARGPRLDALASTDLADAALGPLTVAANIDSAGLRALIAEALIDHVLDRQADDAEAPDADAELDAEAETP
jgi:hypothetical protein